MSDIDRKSKNGNGLIPYSKFREWKFLYFEPGRTGLEDGNGYYLHRGLCKYCVLWQTCSQPKPEGGVWRCEHYVAGPMRPKREEIHDS